MSTPEGEIKARCKALFARVGAYRAMVVTFGYGESGHPDFLVCLHGALVGVETKATTKSPVSALQRLRLKQIRAAGGLAFVVHADNYPAFEALVLLVHVHVRTAMQRIADERGIAVSTLKAWTDYNPLALGGAAWQAAYRRSRQIVRMTEQCQS
ncbi:hypothetical protein P3T23_004505 [Paraburkholderia sp. GAS448]|uniref:hypothetical protein n=1 Tax=Paraburkholderia sp. GAS448 TaxID=3035136 RepID=UPI003D1D408F